MLKFRASSAAGYAYLTADLASQSTWGAPEIRPLLRPPLLQLATSRSILQTTDMRHSVSACGYVHILQLKSLGKRRLSVITNRGHTTSHQKPEGISTFVDMPSQTMCLFSVNDSHNKRCSALGRVVSRNSRNDSAAKPIDGTEHTFSQTRSFGGSWWLTVAEGLPGAAQLQDAI